MTEPHTREPECGGFVLCEDCWGESDPIDDAFFCHVCGGRGWVEDEPQEDDE